MLPIFLFLFALCSIDAAAQGYREWRDTALPEMRTPRRLKGSGSSGFPIGLFVYDYDNNRPPDEIVPYLDSTGIDHMILNIFKHYDGYRRQDNWARYLGLLDVLEASGKRIIPLIRYDGYDNVHSYLKEAEHGREILFYPFDSSQMRRWGTYENVFTDYQYDSTAFNPNYGVREAVYVPRSPATSRTVASGIAFDYRAGQEIRWDQYDDAGTWRTAGNPINSTALFDHIDWEGDPRHTHRAPHYIVVRGHLFEGGAADDGDTLLRVNVWYEVDKGKTYYDSTDTERIAPDNLRFLYKTVGVTKGELKPTDPAEPDWYEYRDAVKRVNFEQEGMGGPTKAGATARRFDLEVVYPGDEGLALRSVGVRDSITHLLMDSGTDGNAYRRNVELELDTLVRYYSTSNLLRPAIYNVNIADEPYFTQFAGFRQVKPLIEASFVADETDTMSTLNGTALPFLQWLGDADWLVSGNYLGNVFYRLGDDFDLNRVVAGVTHHYQDVPSVKQHNGGRWHIAELFDFNTIADPDTAATLPERIEHMELLWNHARMGAAVPQKELPGRFRYAWRVRGLYESALLSRDIGRPFQNYIGPVSNISISYQDNIADYDTNCDHRYERAELRTILRLGLAYGARGMTFYKLTTYPWGRIDSNGHMVSTQEIGLCEENVADTADNIIDWTVRDPNPANGVVVGDDLLYDSLGVVPGLYTGFRNTYREMKESIPWLREIGSFMAGLRWRDAYSVHFQADLPQSDYDNSGVVHRPLPSDEIITSVRASHPITGRVDSAYATYVELGLFETKIDTTGGIRNRMKDTNYVFVVNRRVFETGNYDTADIGYSPAVKALLDTLSESRTIALTFNLPNPDSAGGFVRVREVLPDTARLPLIGGRNILDTVIVGSGGSALLTLGAGRAALLEITYISPDTGAVDGRFSFDDRGRAIDDCGDNHPDGFKSQNTRPRNGDAAEITCAVREIAHEYGVESRKGRRSTARMRS